MVQLHINIGAAPNDGTGTNWRTAWGYIEANFTELYNALSKLLAFETIVLIEAATGYVDKDICHVAETETTYRYEVNGGSYTRDGKAILNTADGGNTRWLAISGVYHYTNLEVRGQIDTEELRFRIKIVPATLSVDTHNYAPTNFQKNGRVVLSASVDVDLTGLDSTNILDGEIRIIENTNNSVKNILLVNNSANSLAANRFYLDADIVIKPNHATMIMYSTNVGTAGGWIVLAPRIG